jgi:hypothetical protein
VAGPAFVIALARAGIRPLAMARAAAPPLLWGGLAAAVVTVVRHFTGDGLVALIAAGGVAMVVYTPVLLWLYKLIRKPAARGSRATDRSTSGSPVPAEA